LGNPVRDDIASIPLPERRYPSRIGGLNVLVLGGSLGAKIFNDILPEVFSIVNSKLPEHIASITHQVGRGNREDVAKEYAKFGIMDVNVVNFIDNMATQYASCDLLICRAGASTVSEVCASGIAAIFVPYPHAVDDHQRYNAEALVSANAAMMFIQSQLTVTDLADVIMALNRSRCEDMARRAKSLAIINSSEKIKEVITSFIA
jgi:UDP-N-acetylglucosamine--N-acetylmuramyl-(pentapeptide) pyrophosphoryl-undecaprenol N-acetylglucosamine transferase